MTHVTMKEANIIVDGERVLQQQQQSGNAGNNNDGVPTSETTTAITVPQVLTRSMIPNLAMASLDAGDVIECYLLTRKSMLHGTVIQITKSALGLRYRHRPATGRKYDDSDSIMSSSSISSSGSSSSFTAATSGSRRRLELTIEYGPARAGSTLGHESIPHIVLEDDPNQYNNNDANQTTASTSGVSWDNEGKVYYTENIDSDSYISANYLASLSGTLLTKLLNSAVDFMQSGTAPFINHHQQQQTRRRRYQPFSVYLASTIQPKSSTDNSTTSSQVVKPLQILKSNSDTDFIYYLLTILTDLGVELKPVILPVVTEIRLHAAEMKKIQLGMNNYPVNFYQKLLTCVKAIGSTDYSVYNISKDITTDVPTVSPSILEGPTILLPSMIIRPPKYAVSTSSPNLPPSSNRYYYHRLMKEQDESSVPSVGSDKMLTGESVSHPPSAQPLNEANTDVVNSTSIPTSSPTPQDVDTGDNSGMDMATHQEQAATAAQHAQEAADAAGAADTEDEAVSAAQQAAVYAQKAATVTANQAALIAREAIISGVGSSVAQAISLCFSDPLYGIANRLLNTSMDTTNAEGIVGTTTAPVSTTVYLYWDGTFYYRMNLTTPYVTVASYVRPMPIPPVSRIGREDVVDWSVAFILAILSAIGFLLLLQHVMGRNLKLIRPLYRCQLWFFQPTHFDWNEMMVESEAERGISDEYTFGEDAIPLSMGGRKLRNKAASYFKSGSSHSKNFRVEDWFKSNSLGEADEVTCSITEGAALVEMEMVDRSQQWTSPVSHNGSSLNGKFGRGASFHSDKSFDDDAALTDPVADGNRLLRDPNLVDLPDLTSSSRVAMPVSSQMQII